MPLSQSISYYPLAQFECERATNNAKLADVVYDLDTYADKYLFGPLKGQEVSANHMQIQAFLCIIICATIITYPPNQMIQNAIATNTTSTLPPLMATTLLYELLRYTRSKLRPQASDQQ